MGLLTLLRHGQTDYNAKGLFQGRVDEPLNEVGEDQAKRAAASIGKVDRVLASPLQRAKKTAEAFGMTPEIDEQWIECNIGEEFLFKVIYFILFLFLSKNKTLSFEKEISSS